MIQLLSLLARAGHGKTTIARHLAETYGTETVSLASALKKCAKAVMGFSDEQLYGTQEQKEAIDPRYGFSARIFLQKLGTEGLRQCFGQNIHLEGMMQEIRTLAAAAKNERRAGFGGRDRAPVFVCDDARFKNESAYVRSLIFKTENDTPAFNGTVIKIVCTDAPPSGNDNHPSEMEIDQIDGGMVDAVVVSSRARGVTHLIGEFEAALSLPKLRAVRVALNASQNFRDSLRSFGI